MTTEEFLYEQQNEKSKDYDWLPGEWQENHDDFIKLVERYHESKEYHTKGMYSEEKLREIAKGFGKEYLWYLNEIIQELEQNKKK